MLNANRISLCLASIRSLGATRMSVFVLLARYMLSTSLYGSSSSVGTVHPGEIDAQGVTTPPFEPSTSRSERYAPVDDDLARILLDSSVKILRHPQGLPNRQALRVIDS